MENYFNMELLAVSRNESFARSAVAAFAVELSPTIEQLNDIKTAVSEAVTNCIVHAYDKSKPGVIYIKAAISGRAVQIEIADNGTGIEDVDAAMQPFFTTKPEQERSGMGFTIMKTFMDELEVFSDRTGTRVLMKKYLGGKEA